MQDAGGEVQQTVSQDEEEAALLASQQEELWCMLVYTLVNHSDRAQKVKLTFR